jgi:hypothetical protein
MDRLETEIARAPAARDPVAAYNDVTRILSSHPRKP